MTIKCPACNSTNLFIREWTKRFTVGMDILLNPPQERPRGKCMDCKWTGGFPLEQDIVISKGFGKRYDLYKQQKEMNKDINAYHEMPWGLDEWLIEKGWRKG